VVATTLLAVAGAHLQGEPLNPVLMALGATFVQATRTAPVYRMVVLPELPGRDGLPGTPSRPGLIRCTGGAEGFAVEIELYRLPVEALGALILGVAPPLAIGTVSLAGGTGVPGFVCEGYAAHACADISRHVGWRSYLASLTPGVRS
jgi:allophanate hydrolase